MTWTGMFSHGLDSKLVRMDTWSHAFVRSVKGSSKINSNSSVIHATGH